MALEFEIVAERSDARLSYAHAALRMLVLTSALVLGVLLDLVADLGVGARGFHTAASAAYVVGVAGPLVELARASWRTPDRRTLWDRAAGSRVRYRVAGGGGGAGGAGTRGGAAITAKAAQVVAAGGRASAASPAARAA